MCDNKRGRKDGKLGARRGGRNTRARRHAPVLRLLEAVQRHVAKEWDGGHRSAVGVLRPIGTPGRPLQQTVLAPVVEHGHGLYLRVRTAHWLAKGAARDVQQLQ